MTRITSRPKGGPSQIENNCGHWFGMAGGACFAFVTIWLVARGSFVHDGIRGFTLFDDAMISMRYAYNYAHSGIIEWSNSSGRVEGFTNLGWTMIMAVIINLSSIYTAPLFVSIVSALMLLAGIYLVGTRQSKFASLPFGLRLIALAGSFSLVVWGVRGFEVSIIFLIISVLYVVTSSKKLGAGAGASVFLLVLVGVLTRDDFAVFAIIYSALIVLFKLFQSRSIHSSWKTPLLLGASAVVAFGIKVLFRLIYFGEPLPNTYYLKVLGHEKLIVIARGLLALFGNSLAVFAPLILVCILLFFYSKKTFGSSLIINSELDSHLIAGALLIYSGLVGGDAWEWSGLANRFHLRKSSLYLDESHALC